MSPNESYPQHVVTVVIVAHDGAAWLPHVADAVLDQTRPVQRVVAVDTGSRDRSGAVLASKFGQAAVFGMDRGTGYGAAIARALAHRAANLTVAGTAGGASGDKVEWLWLLHDDCEPAPDALEQLLRGAAETGAATVLGPKIRDWSSREVILEAGVTLDTATRRVTGIEPREVDQGQHDGDRDALAVSSAGMLVRRDVWEHVGGFDTGMGLFMEDIDFCWRVHSAGYRVRVITDAIVYHAQAATKRRRVVSVGRRPRMLDRRNGLLTLLGNLPLWQMLTSAGGNLVISLLRTTFFLLAKRLAAAMDEAAAIVSVLCHPIRLIRMRRQRSSGRRAAYARIRADLPPGRSVRRLFEFAASTMLKSAQVDTAGAHHASADPTDDDSMLVDNGLGKRLLTSPSLLTFVVLLAIALYSGRSLIGSGPLGGGSLVPAWGGASDLWHTYLQAFHPSGVGSTAATPTYLAVIAGLATLLGGKPWLAVDVMLIGCVPLAGMTAMLAVRRVTKSALVRVWASASYALLPVATGIIASGRFGSAVVFVLLPLIALLAGRVVTQSGPQASRAAWAAGLLAAVGAAFVPLLWIVVLAASCVAAIAVRNTRPGTLRNLLVMAVTGPVLLLPWTLTLFSHPADLLLEAGLPQPGTPAAGLPARMLMLLSPGGPGLPPYWATGGLLAVAFAALFAGRRRRLIMAGWAVALSGMLLAIVVSHLLITPADGGPVVVWAGFPLAIAALGLLLAASVGADALSRLLAGRKGWKAIGTGRGLWAALVALTACSAPLIAAAAWISTGVSGPVHPVTNQVVPELVAVADGQGHQVRTLVLRSSGGRVSYLLLRGPSPSLADAALTAPAGAQQALSKVVAALTTPGGGQAANQSQLLADFDIGYVLVQAPVDPALAGVLDDVSGLRPYSTTSGYDLWQLMTPPARVTVVEPNGTLVPIPSGPIGVAGASVPAVGGTLLLAEPAGGWSAAVDGHSLTPVTSPAGRWAQAFRLPPGGGSLSISHSALGHDLVLLFEMLALLAVVGLALPGIHLAESDGQHAGQAQGAERAAEGAAGRASGASRAAGSRRAGSAEEDEFAAAEADDEDEDQERRDDLVGAPGRAGSGRSASGRSPRRASRGRPGKATRGKAGRDKAGRGNAGRGKAGRGKAGRDEAVSDEAVSDEAGRDEAGREKAGRDAAAMEATGRDGAAGRDRTGRSRPGQPVTGGRTGRDRTVLDDTGTDETGRDVAALPGGRRARVPGRTSRSAGQRGARLADAWPHSAADEPDEQHADLVGGPQARAWPYLDDRDPGGGASDDLLSTESSERSYQAGEGEPRGRRSLAGGSSLAGRSPAGAWPYADLDEAGGDGDPALPDRASSRRGLAGRSPSGMPPSGMPPGDMPPTGRSPSGVSPSGSGMSASGRSPSGSVPARDWSDPARDDRDSYDSDRYDSDRHDIERHDSDRYDRGRRYGGGDSDYSASGSPASGSRASDYDASDYDASDYDASGYGAGGARSSGSHSRDARARDARSSGSHARDARAIGSRSGEYGASDHAADDDSRASGYGGRLDRSGVSGSRPGPWPDALQPDGGDWTERRPGGARDPGPAADPAERQPGRERPGWRFGSGRAGNSADPELDPEPARPRAANPASGRVRPERDRLERDRPERDRPERDRPERDRPERDRPERDRPGPDRQERAGREPAGRELASGPRGMRPDDQGLSRWDSARPARQEGQDRWGRRGRDTRSTGPTRIQPDGSRAAEPLAGWPDGGGDALEPLPPLDGPGQARSRGPAWRSDTGGSGAGWDRAGESGGWQQEGGHRRDGDRPQSRGWDRGEPDQVDEAAGDWDRLGDSQRNDHRWSTPEPEYEGDTW